MENKNLIDLGVKYGLNSDKVYKLADVLHQAGIKDPDSPEFKKAADFICENSLLEMPVDDLIEELKRKKVV